MLTSLVSLALGAISALGAFQPPAAVPSVDDGRDPAVTRDVAHYNLDKDKLALKGWDPVAYFSEGGGRPMRGDARFAYRYRGAVYRFADASNLARFRADPRRYEPAHGGWCSTAMAEGRKVDIDPRSFKITSGRLFLFYTNLFTDARDDWVRDEPVKTSASDRHWKRISGEEARVPSPPAPTPDAPADPSEPPSA